MPNTLSLFKSVKNKFDLAGGTIHFYRETTASTYRSYNAMTRNPLFLPADAVFFKKKNCKTLSTFYFNAPNIYLADLNLKFNWNLSDSFASASLSGW